MVLGPATKPPFPASTEPPVLDEVTQAFVDRLAVVPPMHDLALPQVGAAFARLQAAAAAPAHRTVTEEKIFPVGPTGRVGARFVWPKEQNGRPLPIIIYLHGGGWVMGSADTHDRLVRELAGRTPAAVVSIEYDLAPEARYPVQLEQAYAALLFIVANADALGFDASRIALAGDEAGGAIAASVALLAKWRRGPEIALQVLFCPVTADIAEGGSYAAFADGPWLTRAAMRRAIDAALPDADSRQQATAFPLLASIQELNDLPEALIITAECDVLRDEAEAYARRLCQAGVRVTSTRYNGTIHGFVVLNELAASPSARSALAQAVAALQAALLGGQCGA